MADDPSRPFTADDATTGRRKVALVTGAARGLGRACAEDLARHGYDIASVDLEFSEETADAVRTIGTSAVALRCDVSQPDEVQMAVGAVQDVFGRCDVLVNNAGIFPRRAFDDVDIELWRHVLDVNVTSAFLFAKQVVPAMRERGFGRIINISSNTVGLGVENMTHYVTSKAAVVGFTRSLASEVGKHGITVNAVAPGATPTEGMLGGHSSEAATEQELQPFQMMMQRQAVKRFSRPDDIAGAVTWLASDAASFVSAQTLVVDGGFVRL